MSVKKLCVLALFICFAAALSALETLLPPIVPIPGIRVGLGNIVTMFVLYAGGKWRAADAFVTAVLRCFLAALITGSMMSALYGLCGGILACTAMTAARAVFPKTSAGGFRYKLEFLPFVGVCGAIFHIAGQMACAVLMYGTVYVLSYVPVLLSSAIIGGAFTGLCAMIILKKMPEKLLKSIRNT